MFLILEKRLQPLATEYDVICGFVTCGLSYVEVCSFYTHFVESFYHKWLLSFFYVFFCIYWDNQTIFILGFVNVVYYVDSFVDVALSLHSWNKFHLIMVYDSFNVLLIFVC